MANKVTTRSLGKPLPNFKPRNKRSARPYEPRTTEGRARKKLQLGVVNGLGCVLTHAEMMLVIAQLPKEWLSRRCE